MYALLFLILCLFSSVHKALTFSGRLTGFPVRCPHSHVHILKSASASDTHLPVIADKHLLEYTYAELTQKIGGSGKAKIIWELLKRGLHPVDEGAPSLEVAHFHRLTFPTSFSSRLSPLAHTLSHSHAWTCIQTHIFLAISQGKRPNENNTGR